MRPQVTAPAIVTGGAAGVGLHTARRLAARGRLVVAVDEDGATLHRELDSVAGIHPVVADIRDEAARSAIVADVERRHGPIGALVNNAGFGIYAPVETLALADLRAALETNVLAGIGLAQQVLPGMRRAGRGRIVVVGSIVGHASVPLLGGYAATKHTVVALYDSLRMEVAQFGVDVVQVEPGAINTGFPEHTIGLFEKQTARPPSPYHGLTLRQRRLLVAWLRSPVSASGPEVVADTVVRAVEATRVRSRYRPTVQATASVLARRVTPDVIWDRILRIMTRM